MTLPVSATARRPTLPAQPAGPTRATPPAASAPAAPADGFVAAAAAPHALASRPAKDSDGRLIGRDGLAYPPSAAPADLPGFEPAAGGARETILFVNGIGVPPGTVPGFLQAVADTTGQRVVGIYNATEGSVRDILQCGGDKLDKGLNPAVETTARLVLQRLQGGGTVRLAGHSQGALIISRALEDVAGRLRAEGRGAAEVEALLGRVSVETFGGAAASYPDGPRYTHYLNQADFVPRELGLGETRPPLFDLSPKKLGVDTRPGRGATVIEFREGSLLDRLNPVGPDHLLGTYLRRYRPPEAAASHPERVEVPGRAGLGERLLRAVANPVGALVGWARGLLE